MVVVMVPGMRMGTGVFVMLMPVRWVLLPVVLVPVVPQLCLVQQKKEHNTHQKQREQLVGAGFAFKSFGQQVKKSGGQQSTRRQAEHVLGVARQNAQSQSTSQPDAADTSHHGAGQNCE